MIKKKLSDIVTFTAGKNITRLNNVPEDNIYTQSDFENDLQGLNQGCTQGCIINLMKSKAAPLSQITGSKCLITNFVLCNFDTDQLDPWYFCYLFNESKEIEKQLNRFQQGTVISVRKLTIKNIGELEIKIINFEKQKVIGKLYKEYVRKDYLMHLQIENISKLTRETIRKIEED